jgi:tetratricopeptide (TPR) repeat protein
MNDQLNTRRLSKTAIASFILSFLVLLPGMGFVFLPIVAILIVVSTILLKKNPSLTGSKFLFASVSLCILGIFINFYIVSHPTILYRFFVRSTQDIIAQSPESKDTLMEQARKMEGGEELIKESTLSDGTIDTKKLFNLITNAQIKKFDKIMDEGQKMREKRKESERYFDLARKYEKEGKYDLALEQYNANLNLYPEWELLYEERARMYEKLGNYTAALNDLSRALEFYDKQLSEGLEKHAQEKINSLKSSRISTLIDRGDIYCKIGDYTRAIDDYSKSIDSGGNYAWTYFLRGLAYRKSGDLEKTKQNWQTALSMGLKLNDFNEHEADGDGDWNGKAVWYYPNGNIKTEGSYKNGKEDGIFKFYDEFGASRGERTYKDGVEVGR